MTINEKQLVPVSILHEKLEEQAFPTRKHNFHEFIFVLSGEGIHTKQDIRTSFSGGDLFFVRAKQEHAFIAEQSTEIYIVRFTEQARLTLRELVENSSGKAVPLAKAQSPLNPKVSLTGHDLIAVQKLFELLWQLQKEPAKNENIFYYQIMCLVTLIERNLSYRTKEKAQQFEKPKINRILKHIHKHLQAPELLTLGYMADKFYLSPNRLGEYFRKEMGQSVKKYIQQCRMEIIEEKVIKSDLSFSEITFQFGFTDESHFYKSFKKYFGMSPTSYRNNKLKKESN